MRNTVWMLVIAVTFILGFYLGQQNSLIGSLGASVEVNPVTSQLAIQDNTKELIVEHDFASNKLIKSQGDNKSGTSSATYQTSTKAFEQIDKLLQSLEVKPEDEELLIELYSLVNKLSLKELNSLILTLNDKSEAQRKMLAELIVGPLIKLDPRKALSIAQQFIPMPEKKFFLGRVKSAIAKVNPEYGFELLAEGLDTANSETELLINSMLISELAKHDLNRLMDTLVQYKDEGVNIAPGLWGLSRDLKSSEEFSELFDQLKNLDDLDLLDSAMMNWIDISAEDLFDKLNDIDDANDRQVLIEKAQHYWLMNDPETAADSLLIQAENKKEVLDDILRLWPNKQAEEGLLWLSRQENIDVNSYKIKFLDNLIYSKPEFVQAHLADLELNKDKQAAFHLKLYSQYQQRSTKKADKFLNSLANKNDVIALIEKKSTPTPTTNYRDKINKAFNNYYNYKEAKAFAVAIDSDGEYAWAFRVNQANQNIANQLALESCEQYRSRQNLTSKCRLYAEGDVILFAL